MQPALCRGIGAATSAREVIGHDLLEDLGDGSSVAACSLFEAGFESGREPPAIDLGLVTHVLQRSALGVRPSRADSSLVIGDSPLWLPDSRRLIFHHQGKAYLIDSQSKRMHEVLSVAPHAVSWQFGLSRDGRQIVFTLDATEADVWLMSLE